MKPESQVECLKEEAFIVKKTFRLAGLDCANCAAKIERAIGKLDGVRGITIDFMTTKMVIDAEDEKMDKILSSAEEIIKKIEPEVEIKKA
jgi:copper chaperone CopZ